MIGIRKSGHQPDYVLLALVVILTLFGLAMLASASSELGKIRFNDSYYYLKHQAYFGLSLGDEKPEGRRQGAEAAQLRARFGR